MTGELTLNEQDVIRMFLRAQSTMALATTDHDGNPEITPVFFASDDALNLYWLSAPDNTHSLNLDSQPHAACTIYGNFWHWDDFQGLQIKGKVSVVTDERIREQIITLYLRKFNLPSSYDPQIQPSQIYVLIPSVIRWIEKDGKFGYDAEHLPAAT